jgi:hypothetical protein
LRVSKEFAETKCLLILRKVPLREAMDRLAQTFGGEWRQPEGAKGPDYILYRRKDVAAWLDSWRKHRAEAERHARAFQKQGMREAFEKVQTSLKDAPDLSDANNDPPPPNVSNIGLARFLGSISPVQLDALFEGMAAHVTVRDGGEPESAPPTLQLPFNDLSAEQKRMIREWVGQPAGSREAERRLAALRDSRIGIGLNQDGSGTQITIDLPSPHPPLTSDVTFGSYLPTAVEAKLQTELFRLLSARTTPPGAILGANLTNMGTATPAAFVPDPAPAPLPLKLPRGGGLSREFLPALADAHEWSLVSDCHFRSNRYAAAAAPSSLEETLKGAADRFQLVFRQEGNFLLARSRVWPDRDEEETPWPYPERWLKAREAGEGLSVDDLIVLSQLDPVQLVCIRAYNDRTSPFRHFRQELRMARANHWVWDLVRRIGPALRRVSESSEGLPFTNFPPALQDFVVRSSLRYRDVSSSGDTMPPEQWNDVGFHLVSEPSMTRPNEHTFRMVYLKARSVQQPFWAVMYTSPREFQFRPR